MRIFIQFENNGDIIDCPESIVSDLPNLRERFLVWLFNEKNNHPHWVYQNGKKAGCAYRADVFVQWLNTYVLKHQQNGALFLQTEVESMPEDMPSICLL